MNFEEDFASDDTGYNANRYANAYGDYRGGYRGLVPMGPTPPLGFGPMPPFSPVPVPPPVMDSGPPAIFGRGYNGGMGKSPQRPLKTMDEPALKYLIRCGVPRENLKGLPRHLLNLIQPEFCGLCNQSFDSFSISRIHYLSKNHLKNQKKYLQNAPQTGSRNQEAPIKSRDLYCELCDVQITSKVHADSHYAGKSHKAIVTERKRPKNPALLQPGMERRVQQLIRREKKSLKDVIADEKSQSKEAKPIQPDLYCEICKTSVTCSEQMTAHMNGKKHLTREKQYILKQMRGETGADEAEEGDNAGGVGGEDQDAVDSLDTSFDTEKEEDTDDIGQAKATADNLTNQCKLPEEEQNSGPKIFTRRGEIDQKEEKSGDEELLLLLLLAMVEQEQTQTGVKTGSE